MALNCAVGAGSLATMRRRALDRWNVTEALSASSGAQILRLAEALELTLLLADQGAGEVRVAAARWHTRFVQVTPNVGVRQSQAVLALLIAIPSERLAAGALADLSDRRSCERTCEALVRWARAA